MLYPIYIYCQVSLHKKENGEVPDPKPFSSILSTAFLYVIINFHYGDEGCSFPSHTSSNICIDWVNIDGPVFTELPPGIEKSPSREQKITCLIFGVSA
jgi:hypothetical protein